MLYLLCNSAAIFQRYSLIGEQQCSIEEYVLRPLWSVTVTNPHLTACFPVSPTFPLNLLPCPSLSSSILHSPPPPHLTTLMSNHSKQLYLNDLWRMV